MSEAADDRNPRGYLARAGITALNLITPGLGLLRVGEWRTAVLFAIAPFVLIILFTLGMGLLPITSFSRVMLTLATVVSLMGALYFVSAALTWRKSRLRSPVRAWSRWYGLTAIAIALAVMLNLMPPLMHRLYKPFFAPSESMAPTIGEGDKFIADMLWRGPYRRGEIIIFKAPNNIRASRIAALPGDRIAMHGGVPIVNGKPANQLPNGRIEAGSDKDSESAALLTEQLPGEASTHQVLNMGAFDLDEMPEIIVPANRLFVLGDNRDRSADSRVPPDRSGVGMVPMDSVLGRPMYIHWSSDRAKIGTRLDN